MFQHYKDQNWCDIGYLNVQKMSFHIFGHLGQILSFWLPWQLAIN